MNRANFHPVYMEWNNMQEQEYWDEICFIVDRYRQTNASENSFQIEAENIFEKLGWSRFKGEVISQDVINVGSAHTVRPDIVITDGKERQYVVELKKPSTGFVDRNADQLISYMRLLRLNHGILLGDSIRVFYDKPDDKEDPVEVADIPLTRGNSDGVRLLETIRHDGFTPQRFTEYCTERIRLKDMRKNAETQIRMLCGNAGTNFIAEAVRKAIAEDESEQIATMVVEALTFGATRKDSTTREESAAHSAQKPQEGWHRSASRKHERTTYKKYRWDPDAKVDMLELHPREGESFQDHVRRTMHLAIANNMLTDQDLTQLQDLAYCKRTFGLSFPLLVDNRDKVYDSSGHARYWTRERFGNYYCCSQWWKARIPYHEKLFAQWIASVNEKNSVN